MQSRIVVSMMCVYTVGAAVDRWALDGHGNNRQTFSGTGNQWTRVLTPPKGTVCQYPAWNTPFSGYQAAGGVALSDSGVIYLPLYCNDASSGHPYVAVLDANAGSEKAFPRINASSWDSYLKQMPDGTLAAGVDDSRIIMLDATTLDVIASYSAGGDGGAQVIAVSKTNPPQIQTAGGDGGPDWWGQSCDIKNGHELSNCALNGDTTVCMGANGVSMYNNQRFEAPQGAVRWDLPFTANSKLHSYNTATIQWPWWIRSTTDGRTVVYDGSSLQLYSNDYKQLWSISPSVGYMGLQITDDETTVVMSSSGALGTFNLATGVQTATYNYNDFKGSCGTVISPWAPATPVLMGDSQHVILLCSPSSGAQSSFVKVIDIKGQKILTPQLKLSDVSSQAIVDSAGNLYSFGVRTGEPVVQRVNVASVFSFKV